MTQTVKRKISEAILLVAASCFFSLAPGMVAEAVAVDFEMTKDDYLASASCYDTNADCRQVFSLGVGQIFGAAAMLKNLHCVFGNRKCACMENVFQTTMPANDLFSDNIITVLRGVSGSTQMGVVGYEAMNRTCR